MASDRHAKGVNVIDLVKSLRTAQKAGDLETLPEHDQALIDQRVLVTDWFPFEDFRRLLHLTHSRVFDGSKKSAQVMGEFAGQTALQGVHSAFLRENNPYGTVKSLERIWKSYFDFGQVEVEHADEGVRVIIRGYMDLDWVHGHLLVGWVSKAAELAGGQLEHSDIERAPWLGDSEFVLLLRLRA